MDNCDKQIYCTHNELYGEAKCSYITNDPISSSRDGSETSSRCRSRVLGNVYVGHQDGAEVIAVTVVWLSVPDGLV